MIDVQTIFFVLNVFTCWVDFLHCVQWHLPFTGSLAGQQMVTYRQTDIQWEINTDRQTDSKKYIQTDKQTAKQTEIQTDSETDRETDRQRNRQRDRQTDIVTCQDRVGAWWKESPCLYLLAYRKCAVYPGDNDKAPRRLIAHNLNFNIQALTWICTEYYFLKNLYWSLPFAVLHKWSPEWPSPCPAPSCISMWDIFISFVSVDKCHAK